MNRLSTNVRAFLIALAVCIASFATFIFVWYEVRPSFMRTEEFILAIVAGAIALLSVLVFQSFRMSMAARDIAAELAESMLMSSRDLFTELYRNSPVPYLVIDKHFNVDSANLAAVRLYGVEQGWLEGKNIFDSLRSESDTREGLIRQYFSEQVSVNNEEVEVLRPDGGERWALLSLFPFRDAEREQKGLLTLFDITKQKEIDKAKTEFVSLASHQLRTPITAIKWNVELLDAAGKSHFTDGERGYVEKIAHSVARMDSLVSDFLSVSKLELGTFEPHLEEVSLDQFLTSILESHEKTAEARRITIERAWDRALLLQTDPHLLEMAVSNLVSNAIKYTPDTGVVRIASEVQSGHTILSVSDTGMGIPKGEQDKIFSKIFRATNAKAEVPEGTGLGLYIAREAVRVMGGNITFVSTEGKGTTFTVLLP